MVARLLILFCLILVAKLLTNLARYLQVRYYLNSFMQQGNEKSDWRFAEQAPQVVRLFKEAGIEDTTISEIEPIGYGHIRTSQPSVFANLAVKRQDIVNHVLGMFHEAIGIYRHRALESLNPFFWLEVIIFLPRRILEYLGASPDSVAAKVAQVIYWLVSLVFGLYQTEIATLIREWIANSTP